MSDWKVWCPIIGDICENGWNEKMGMNEKKDKNFCAAWHRVEGENPQNGEKTNELGCMAFKWIPLFLIQMCKLENSTGAAVESLRNRAADVGKSLNLLAHTMANKPVITLTGGETPPALENKTTKE